MNVQQSFSVVFTGGEYPSAQRCRALAAGARFIATADSGLIAAEETGFTPDIVIGDMDSLEQAGEARRLDKYPADRIIRRDINKDQTDTELALEWLFKHGEARIKLIGGGGGRLDHIFGIQSLFERPARPESWHTKYEDIYAVDAAGVWQARAGSVISVFPLGSGGWEAESEGLTWPLDGLGWEKGRFGISNIAAGGTFTIKARRGTFMVIINI